MAIAQGIEDLDVRAVEWVKKNRRTATLSVAALALVGGSLWFWWTAQERREIFAERALSTARGSAEAGNLPLASSDLSRMVSTYGGTRAAQEATLLLAQVQLLQKQPALAVGNLRKFLASSPREEFRGPANGLLGAALEESAQPLEAAKAYEAAANATSYKGVEAQYLVDAGRTFATAGDTAQAARVYERVIKEFKSQSAAAEAEVRLAELRKSPPKEE